MVTKKEREYRTHKDNLLEYELKTVKTNSTLHFQNTSLNQGSFKTEWLWSDGTIHDEPEDK